MTQHRAHPKWLVKMLANLLLAAPAGLGLLTADMALATTDSIAKTGHSSARYLAQVGNTPAADRLFQQGMELYREGGAESLRQAIQLWQQAAQLYQQAGNQAGEAGTLTGIGLVYSDLGEQQQALDYFNQALPLWRAVEDRAWEARTLNNIGMVYSDLGEQQQALDYVNQALPLWRAVGDRAGEATTLASIGMVYSDLGEKQQALDYVNQALPLWRAVGDRAGEAATLSNIGAVYSDLGEKQQALDYFNQALPLSRAVGDRAVEARTLNNIGIVYSDLGEKQQALDYYNQALPLSRAVGNRAQEATTLNNIGTVYSALGEQQQALDYYNQALPLMLAVGDRSGEAVTLGNVASLYRDQDNLDLALDNIEAAIALIEELRAAISNTDLQTTYFSTVQGYYQFKIDILMQLGQPEAAFNTSEAARARTLLELLNEAQVDIRQGVDPTLLAAEQALQQQLRTIESRRVALVKADYTEADLQALDEESDAVLQQLEQKLAEIREVSPASAELKDPQPLTLPEIRQQVLDTDTVLLQYALGKDQSYLWIVGSGANEFEVYTLPGQNDLNANDGVVRRFNRAVNTPGPIGLARVMEPGKALQEAILPELPEWAAGKRLLVAGDGILNQVPFAALPIPHRSDYTPLLMEHELLSQPSASAIAILRQELGNRPIAPRALAVLADPIYTADDARLTGQATAATAPDADATDNVPVLVASNLRSLDLDKINRLPNTRLEADKILALLPDADTSAVFDLAANYNWVEDPSLEQYRIVHLATHGFVNEVNPQLSGIVLALVDENGHPRNDGFLRLHDIFNLRLNADLVVLSACQTGRGQEVNGEGIVGISRGFMYAGAERLLVSLWNVNDAKTAELMEKVYRYMLQDHLTPAAALQSAQRDMLAAGDSPYFWAAFTPQGEWR